jgi:hypothetical protein
MFIEEDAWATLCCCVTNGVTTIASKATAAIDVSSNDFILAMFEVINHQ